ncbi:hypothetical protein AAC387_Pa07g3236 [Persea americana]
MRKRKQMSQIICKRLLAPLRASGHKKKPCYPYPNDSTNESSPRLEEEAEDLAQHKDLFAYVYKLTRTVNQGTAVWSERDDLGRRAIFEFQNIKRSNSLFIHTRCAASFFPELISLTGILKITWKCKTESQPYNLFSNMESGDKVRPSLTLQLEATT